MNISNLTAVEEELEDFEVFDQRDLMNVLAHSFMCIVGVGFNLVSLVTAFRVMRRPDTRSKTNVHFIVFQLIIADSLASFIVFPMEAIWRYTIQWYASNILCKILLMLRLGSFYLSSNTLLVLSVDRYISISRPFSAYHVNNQRKRLKIMLVGAWMVAGLCSLPQAIIFRKMKHPYKDFHQCASVGYFESIATTVIGGDDVENVTLSLYGIHPVVWTRMYEFYFNVFVFYIPLLGIVLTYGLLHLQMIKRNENIQTQLECSQDDRLRKLARKSQMTALKMSVIHTLAFVLCWLPYIVYSTWSVFAGDTVVKIPVLLQDLMGLSGQFNTCINPIVYSAFYFSHIKVLGKRQPGDRLQFISLTSFRSRRPETAL